MTAPAAEPKRRLSTVKKEKAKDEPAEIVIQGIEQSENMFIAKHLRGFHEFDLDNNGTISQAELKEVLDKTKDALDLSDRDIKKVLKEVDSNGDDSVSFGEFLDLAKKLTEMQNKSKGKASRIPRLYLDAKHFVQYKALFHAAAGEDDSVDITELQAFFEKNRMKISEDRLKSIMEEVDDDGSGQLEQDEFLILLIKALGIKKRKVGPDQCPAMQLRKEGWALGEMRKLGYDCASLREAGFSTLELMDVFNAKELLKGGVPVSELLVAGWDCRQAREAGFRIADLVAGGASVRKMRVGGFTDLPSVVALRKLGVEAWKMKQGGFSLSALRDGGYSTAELRLAGFSTASIAALGKLHNHLKHLPALHRQSTLELRKEAEERYQQANMDIMQSLERSAQSASGESLKELSAQGRAQTAASQPSEP